MQQCGSQEHEASAKLRGEIDAELAILYERVRILHAKRNTISPLYRLPSEIFIRIFIEYQYLVIDDQNLRTRKAYKVWIRILQLSQYLRRIGLESPELWSNITRTDRRWVSKFIERSRSNDLRVGMFVYEEASVDLFKQVMANSDRISTLSISTSLRCWEDVIPALKSPAPRLIALKLYLHGASIPVDLFPESFSKLKNLGVTSCNVDLKHPLFTQTNLTALSITSPTSAIRTTDILHLLERLPALRSLWLSHALQVAGDGRYLVSLPHLTSLDLRHPDLDTNKNFLTSIRLPENVDISLYSNKIERGTQNLIADLMDSVKLALQKTSLVFRDLTVNRMDCESGISMTCTKQPRCQSGVRSSPFIDVDLRFTKAGHGPHAEEWLIRSPQWLLAPLEVLKLKNGKSISRETWDYLAGILLNLRHLYLGSQPEVASFIQYLNFQHPDDPPAVATVAYKRKKSNKPEMVYPALRRLTLVNISYEHLLILCHPLAARKQGGMVLDELCLVHRGPKDPEAQLKVEVVLREHVKMIRWRE